MQKGFWIIVILVVAGMIGLFAITGGEEKESTFADYDPSVIQLTDHITGIDPLPDTQAELDTLIADRPAVLIEYGDFQCPACRVFFPVMDQLKSDFEGQLVTVFRNFPLTSIHFDAMAAHRAAEAAANQGMFWEMHDLLYERQFSWVGSGNVPSTLEGLASGLDLDIDLYKTDVSSEEVFDRIDVDISSARPLNVNSTPTVFFNGQEVDSPTYESLTEIISSALEEANS